RACSSLVLFFIPPATPCTYTLSLHDALPICCEAIHCHRTCQRIYTPQPCVRCSTPSGTPPGPLLHAYRGTTRTAVISPTTHNVARSPRCATTSTWQIDKRRPDLSTRPVATKRSPSAGDTKFILNSEVSTSSPASNSDSAA